MGAFPNIRPKSVRMNVCNAVFVQFSRNKSEFWRQLITVDETWIHYCTPKSKTQTKQCIAKGESAPKKAKTVFSAGKVIATVLGDSNGVIAIDYLQEGKDITGAYYSSLLGKLKAEIAKNGHIHKKEKFHQEKRHFTHQRLPWWKFTNYVLICRIVWTIHQI